MSTKRYQLPSPRNHPHKSFITRQSSVAVIRGREKSLLTSQYQILPHTPSTEAAAAAANNGVPPPQPTSSKFLYSSPSSHTMQQQYLQKRLPRPTLPVWNKLGVHDKLPYPMQVFECEFSTRTKIGTSQMPKLVPIDFDLTDPYNVHNSDVLYYNPLYDPHLAHFYRRPNQLETFRAIGQATESGHVACTLKQYNEWRSRMYQRYLLYVRALRRQSRIWSTIYLLKNAKKNIRSLRQKKSDADDKPADEAAKNNKNKRNKNKVGYCDDAENLDNIAEHINYLDKPKDLNEFLPENYFVAKRTRGDGRRDSLATRSKLRPFVEAEKLLARARIDVANEYEMAVHTHHAKVEVDHFYDRLRWAKAYERRKNQMSKVVRERHTAVDERIERLWVKTEQTRRKKAKHWLTTHIEFQKLCARNQKAAAELLKNYYAGKVEAHERESRENYSQWRSSMNNVKSRIERENASSATLSGGERSAASTKNKSDKVSIIAPRPDSSADGAQDQTAADGTLSTDEHQTSAEDGESVSSANAKLRANNKRDTRKSKRPTRTLTSKKIARSEKSMASLSCLTETTPKPVSGKKRPAKRHSVRAPNAQDLENSEFVSLPTPTSSAIAGLASDEYQRKSEQQQARARAAKQPPRLKTKGGVSLATIVKGRGKQVHQTSILGRQSGGESQQLHQQHHHVPLQEFKRVDLDVLPTLAMPPNAKKLRKKSTAGNAAADGGALDIPKSNADMTSRLSSMPGSAENAAGQQQSTADNNLKESASLTPRKLRIPTLSVTAIGSDQYSNEELLKTMTPDQAELYRQQQQQAAASSSMLLSDELLRAAEAAKPKERKKSRKSFILPNQPGSSGLADAAEGSNLQLESASEMNPLRSGRVPTLSVTAFNDAGQYEKQYNKLLADVVSTSSSAAAEGGVAAGGEDGNLAGASSADLSREQIRTRQRSKKSFVLMDEQSRARNLLGDDAAVSDGHETSQAVLASSSSSSVASLLERAKHKQRAPTLNLIQFNAEKDANSTTYEREYNEMLASTTTIRELSDTSLARVQRALTDQQQAKSNKSSLFGFSHQQSTALIGQARSEVDPKRQRPIANEESQPVIAGADSYVVDSKKRAKKKSFVLPKTAQIIAAEQQQAAAGGNVEQLAERLTYEVLSSISANVDANQTNPPYTTSPLSATARKTDSDPTVSPRQKPDKVRRFSLPAALVSAVNVRRRDEDFDSMPTSDDDRPAPPTISAVVEPTDSAAFLAASSTAQRKSRTKSEIGTAFERFSLPTTANDGLLSPSDDRRNRSIAGPTAKRGTIVGGLRLFVDSSAVETSRKSADDSLTVEHAAVSDSVVRRRGSEYEYTGDEVDNVTTAAVAERNKEEERPQSAQKSETVRPPSAKQQRQRPPTATEDVHISTRSDGEYEEVRKLQHEPPATQQQTTTSSAGPTMPPKSTAWTEPTRPPQQTNGQRPASPAGSPGVPSASSTTQDTKTPPQPDTSSGTAPATTPPPKFRAKRRSGASGGLTGSEREQHTSALSSANSDQATSTSSPDDNQSIVSAERAGSRAARRGRASESEGERVDQTQPMTSAVAAPTIQTPAPFQRVDGGTQATKTPHYERARRQSTPSSPQSPGQQAGLSPDAALAAAPSGTSSSTKTSMLVATSIEPKISQDATITLSQVPSNNSARNSDSDVYFVRRTVLNVPNQTSQTSTTSDKIIVPLRTSDEASSNSSMQTFGKQKAEPIGTSTSTTTMKVAPASLTASASPEQVAKQKQQRKESIAAAAASGASSKSPPPASAVAAAMPAREPARLAWGAPTPPNASVGSNVSVTTTKAEDDTNQSQRNRPTSQSTTAGTAGTSSVSSPSPAVPAVSPSAVSPTRAASPPRTSQTPLRSSMSDKDERKDSSFWPSLKKKRQTSRSSLGESRRSSRSNNLVPSEQNSGLVVAMADDSRKRPSPSSTTTIREHQAEFSYTDALGITGNDDLMAVESETIVDQSAAGQSGTSSSASRQKKRPQAPLGQYKPEGDSSSNVNVGVTKVADAENDDDEEGIDINLPYKPDLE